MARGVYNRQALTGGGTNALDALAVATLSDGSVAFTMANNKFYYHVFDAVATDAENSPYYIRPDDYSTAGVWVMAQTPYDVALGVMPSGIALTGGIVGGGYAMNSTDPDNDVDFGSIVCMDSTNQAVISSVSTMTKRLDAAWAAGTGNGGLLNGSITSNTIYHLYALLKDSDSSVDFGFLADGDTLSTYLPSGYSKYRWIGFIRTNGSGDICAFTFSESEGHLAFSLASENILSNGITTSYTQVDHSSFLPEEKIARIEYGVMDASASAAVVVSHDGTNTAYVAGTTASGSGDTILSAWGATANQKASLKPFNSDAHFKSGSGTVDLLCHTVMLKR